MTPKASMSSSRYPTYGITSPFAAVNLNQPPVGKTGFPWGQKWSLKNSSVIGDTSDPESKRQGMSTPPNHTVTTGHFPTAFSYTVDISIFEPLLSPPVTWLFMTWGVSALENPDCSCFRGTVKNRSFALQCLSLLHPLPSFQHPPHYPPPGMVWSIHVSRNSCSLFR